MLVFTRLSYQDVLRAERDRLRERVSVEGPVNVAATSGGLNVPLKKKPKKRKARY